MAARFALLIGFFFLAYAGLLFRLYNIQLIDGGYYQARAASQLAAADSSRANRGTIYFTNKNGSRIGAATNKDFPHIYAVPLDIKNATATARTLAPLVGIAEEELTGRLSKKNDPYEPLVDRADVALAEKIESLKIPGIYVKQIPRRSYGFGTLAAHILGFVGPDDTGTGESGRYGIEAFYNETLSGSSGEIQGGLPDLPLATQWRAGRVQEARSGEDIILTIDPAIQSEVESVLEKLVSKYGGDGGGIIVQEPKTGKILALAARPAFDPNNYGASPVKDFLNPMVQQLYEPGSVFKIITMAAGIDSGKLTPETTFTDTGSVTLNGKTIRNYDGKAYGKATMTNVIEHSINTGSVFAERLMGRDIFKRYVQAFGFGEKTGVELPGELKGNIQRLSPKEKDIAFATASYGQGIALTPLEIINAFSAIANGGTLMRPDLRADTAPEEVRRVVSAETALKVTNMMVSAVDVNILASVSGYTVAGKTGTALVPDLKSGGYTNRVINTYVGFAPASDARFTILVKLNEPEGAPLAGTTVVPAFRDLAQFLLNYYGIAPDRLGETRNQ